MRAFLQNATPLNHINLSQMNFQKPQILELLDMFKGCQFLVSIHLSDNKITEDKEYFYECLE